MKRLLAILVLVGCLAGCGACGKPPAPAPGPAEETWDTTPGDEGEDVQGGEYAPDKE